MTQLSIVAFDRFTDIDVFMPWDLLFRAKAAGASDWTIKILGKTEHVTSVAGLRIPTHGRLEETAHSDVVVFASGVGVEDVLADKEFLAALHLDEEKQLIGSMCAGAVILAEKGLLKGRRATTYPTYFKRLAGYEASRWWTRRSCATATSPPPAGRLAAQLLCGWITETLASAELADAVAASILPVGQGCRAFAGWGDPAAAKAVAAAARRHGCQWRRSSANLVAAPATSTRNWRRCAGVTNGTAPSACGPRFPREWLDRLATASPKTWRIPARSRRI